MSKDSMTWLRHTASRLIHGDIDDGDVETVRLCEAADEIDTALSRIRELEGALEPFAEIAKELQYTLKDDARNNMMWAVPSVGDFRRALAALSSKDQEKTNG